jgi:hypothetical protein
LQQYFTTELTILNNKAMKLKKPRNWKTTIFGLSAILSGIAMIVKGQPAEGITAILSGLGLAAAKDYDKTGL